MQTQIITEAGTVIGIYDPKDDQEHMVRDSEIAKVDNQGAWDTAVREKLKELNTKVKAASTPPAAKKGLKKLAADALPKSGAGKAAMVGVPAAAALAASETSRGKIKAKYDASRDIRHYRPASPYYDDGFGKAWKPKWLGDPDAAKTMKDAMKNRTSVPRAAYDATKPTREAVKDAVTKDPGNAMQAATLAAGGATAAAGAVKAAMASRKAAKLKKVQSAKRAQNVRDAAVVGAVAAPVALGTHLLSRRKVEKADELITKGPVKALKRVWKNPGKNSNMAPRDRVALGLQKLGDPDTYTQASGKIADVSGDASRISTNVRSVIEDAKKAIIPKSKQKPPALSTGQKAAIGGAGVGGLLIGRELSGPKPYPYQQQK